MVYYERNGENSFDVSMIFHEYFENIFKILRDLFFI